MISVNALNQRLKEDERIQFDFSHVNFATADSESLESLAMLIKTLKNKKIMSWHGVDLTKIDLSKITPLLKALAQNPKINELTLTKCNLEKVTNEILHEFSSCIKENIKFLDLSNNNICSSPNAISFLTNLMGSKIEELWCSNIGWENCDFANLEKIVKLFSTGKSLNNLNLEFFDFDGDSSQYCQLICIILSNRIPTLTLRNASFGMKLNLEEWSKCLAKIQENSELRSLNLSGCGLGFLDFEVSATDEPEAFIEMFGSFLESTKLANINISFNNFSKETAQKLLKFAVKNKNLKLEIHGNNLTSAEIEQIEKVNQELEQKTKLDKPINSVATDLKPMLSNFTAINTRLSGTTAAVSVIDPPSLNINKNPPKTSL